MCYSNKELTAAGCFIFCSEYSWDFVSMGSATEPYQMSVWNSSGCPNFKGGVARTQHVVFLILTWLEMGETIICINDVHYIGCSYAHQVLRLLLTRSARRKPTTFGRVLTDSFHMSRGWVRATLRKFSLRIEHATSEVKGKRTEHCAPLSLLLQIVTSDVLLYKF